MGIMYLVTTFCNAFGLWLPGSSVSWDFPGKDTRVGLSFLSPGDLPNPGTEPASPVSPASYLFTNVIPISNGKGRRFQKGMKIEDRDPWILCYRPAPPLKHSLHFKYYKHFCLEENSGKEICYLLVMNQIGWEASIWDLQVNHREGNGNPLQDSCLENSMDRGTWQATAHGVAKGRPWLSSSAQVNHIVFTQL